MGKKANSLARLWAWYKLNNFLVKFTENLPCTNDDPSGETSSLRFVSSDLYFLMN